MFRPSGDRVDSKGGCSNDYVRTWLEKTQRRPDWEPATEDQQHAEVPWWPHRLEAVGTEMTPQPPYLWNHRGESVVSSIIPDRERRREHRISHPTTLSRPPTTRVFPDRDGREGHQRTISVSPDLPRRVTGPFEKRARHRTRPDRYETKKRKNTDDGDTKQRARRTKTQGPKKLVSSREVMDNFSSDAILTRGRLTVKPTLTPGLYGNVRCGSPNEVPDLAYHSMEFLSHAKRRCDPHEPSSMGPREDRVGKRERERDESALFADDSPSHLGIHSEGSGDEESIDSVPRPRFDLDNHPAVRPNTAPVEAEATYRTSRRRPHNRTARYISSIESSELPVTGRTSRHGAKSSFREAEGCRSLTPESMMRRLWRSGLFDGMNRASISTPENHQQSRRRRMRRDSPGYRTTKAGDTSRLTRPREEVMPATKGDKANLVSTTAPRLSSIAADTQADKCLGKAEAGIAKEIAWVHVDSPDHVESNYPVAARNRTAAAKVDAPVDRAKIAYMAQIPVYFHRECQTDFLWPQPQQQRQEYIQAETQTDASPTLKNHGQYRIPETVPPSPHSQYSMPTNYLEAKVPHARDQSPLLAQDETEGRRPEGFRNGLIDVQGQAIFGRASEHHQERLALLERMTSDMQRPVYAGCGQVEQPVPLPCSRPTAHPDSRDERALNFVGPADSDTFHEESPLYAPVYEGEPPETQEARLGRARDNYGPACHDVREYYPYPARYISDGTHGPQLFTRDEVVVHCQLPAFNILGEEPSLYPQGTLQPHEQQTYRPSIPPTRSPVLRNASYCTQGRPGYAHYENQVNITQPSDLPSCQRQSARVDFEQAQIEAYCRNRRCEIPRNYGY